MEAIGVPVSIAKLNLLLFVSANFLQHFLLILLDKFYFNCLNNFKMRFYFCSFVSMADLLKKMVTQAKQEGRETLRQLVAAYNGKAGVLIIQEEVKMFFNVPYFTCCLV